MKKIITLAVLFTISLSFFSCGTLKEIPEDKTPAQIIQMGQNYVGNSDYKSAALCYNTVIDRYGSNPAIYVEGKYELGRVYLAQHKYEKAYLIFTEILELYDNYATMLPGAYKKLCNISISQIPEVRLQEIKAKLEAEANAPAEAAETEAPQEIKVSKPAPEVTETAAKVEEETEVEDVTEPETQPEAEAETDSESDSNITE